MYFIDAHSHLHSPWFNEENIKLIIENSKSAGVNKIVSCASDPKNYDEVIQSANNNNIWYTLGFQPTLASEYNDINDLINKINKTKDTKLVAIGEVGLDYHWVKNEKEREKQKLLFIQSIELANEMKLPLVVHTRKAETPSLEILEKYANTNVLMHSFEGNLKEIEYTRDLGYLISVPTNLVIRKNRRKVVKRAGLDMIMLETDSPYCSPVNDLFPNTPATIPIAAEKISQLLSVDLNDVAKITTSNTEHFYKI